MAGGKKGCFHGLVPVGLRVSCTENKDTPIVKIILARRFLSLFCMAAEASIGPTGHCNAALGFANRPTSSSRNVP